MTTPFASSFGPRPWRRGLTLFVSFIAMHVLAAALLSAEHYVEGELLMKFRGGPKSASAKAARDKMRHEVKRDFDFMGWQLVRLRRGMTVEEGLKHYRTLPGVLVAEPNGLIKFSDSTTPNDPMFGQQWALPRIGATNTWAVTTGSSNVVVAVIDTGVNYNHEDLAPNMWRNPGEIPGNGIDDDGNGFVDDVYGINAASGSIPFDLGYINNSGTVIYHGSGCAGILGAAGNNNKGVTGVNWSLQIMAIRLNDDTNEVGISDVMSAFEYVTLMKRRGVNIRVTSNSYYSNPRAVFSQALKDAVDAAGNEGVLNVFVCGNDSTNIDVFPLYPAAFRSPSVLSVAASDQLDNLASFSSYGPTNVHLAAPGVSILTASGASNTAYYLNFAGTSAACPYVAGAGALLFSAYPSATLFEVKEALMDSVDMLPAFTNRMVSNGRLNVRRAMQLLGERLTNAPPNITFQPEGKTISLSNSFAFTAVVTGARPLSYQWMLNGVALADATNLLFGKFAAAESDAGDYVLVAGNGFGATTSSVARLEVLTAPVLLTQPQDRAAPETSNVTFTAVATGYAPQYQWQFHGTNLPGRTGTNLSLTNISTAVEGPYTVLASNTYGMTTSAIATLTVLTFPRIVEPSNPLRIAVVPGEVVTLGVRTTGSLPIGYRWRRANPSLAITNIVLNAHECFLSILVTNAGTYTLVLTNPAQPFSILQRTNAIITVLSDSDGDGLPDSWETEFAAASDPDGDADIDGMTNLQEYRAGTNPTNALSSLKLEAQGQVVGETAIALRFFASSNKTYSVQFRGTIETGAWHRFADTVSGPTNRELEVIDRPTSSNSARFYRLVTPRAP